MGWSRMDGEWWPAVAERIAKPWPEEAAAFDLRWHAEQSRGEVTRGRPFFSARWGWTDWAVKLLLRREELWRDPFLPRQPAASPPPEVRQPAASPPPERERVNADDPVIPASPPPARRQPAASPPPEKRHARVVDPNTLHPTPFNPDTYTSPPAPDLVLPLVERPVDPTSQTDPPAPPLTPPPRLEREAFDRLSARWKERSPGGPPLSPSRGLGQVLAARLKEHGEAAVEAVLVWFATSRHQRAKYLRDEGHGLATLMRPSKFEEYLGYAQGEQHKPPLRLVQAPPSRWTVALEQLEGHMDPSILWLLRETQVVDLGGKVDLRPNHDALELLLDERAAEDLEDALGCPVLLRGRRLRLLVEAK